MSQQAKSRGSREAEARAKRLAQALRDNLRRRKAAQTEETATESGVAATPPDRSRAVAEE